MSACCILEHAVFLLHAFWLQYDAAFHEHSGGNVALYKNVPWNTRICVQGGATSQEQHGLQLLRFGHVWGFEDARRVHALKPEQLCLPKESSSAKAVVCST